MIAAPATLLERPYCGATWHRGITPRFARRALSKRLGDAIDHLLVTQHVLVIHAADRIAAWCCYTPLKTTSVVHYVYVRKEHRLDGIATDLLGACGVDLSAPIPYTGIDGGRTERLVSRIVRDSGHITRRLPIEEVLL